MFPALGGGVFGPSLNYVVGAGPGGVALGDLDGDGKPDIAVAGSTTLYAITLLRNTSR